MSSPTETIAGSLHSSQAAGPGKTPHVVFVNQFFWPDTAPTGSLLQDVALHLVSLGCRVTVVCGQNGYRVEALGDPPPVEIVRVPNFQFVRHPVGRLLSWITFLMLALLRLFRLRHCDLLVTLTTPPGLSVIGAMLSRWCGVTLWIWEMDLYPDVALATGAVSETLAIRLVQRVFTWSRRQADGIIALGDCMRDRLLQAGLAPKKIHIAQNWADGQKIQCRHLPSYLPLEILYSGNLGRAHDVVTILQVMEELAEEDRVRFTFAGGGTERLWLEQRCSEKFLRNVSFRSYGDHATFMENLDRCHIGLITLKRGCEGTVVPSKAYALMAAGRPFLFIGPERATPARLIAEHGCGWHAEPGDTPAITSLVKRLSDDLDEIHRASDAARRAFDRYYDLPGSVDRISRLIVGGEPSTLIRRVD